MRWFLVDKVTELVPGERIRGVKCVTLGDEVLHDHFPDYPILPGVLVIEALAQLAGFLLETTFHTPDRPVRRAVLAQIKDARFYDPVGPGERIDLTAELESSLESAARVRVEASVEGKRVARGEITFAMMEVPAGAERVHEQRRSLYRLWTRALATPPVIP
jgi:3-hydroxyacyl-[acyl-carrier-protein] dehydratase